jgi:hypothetical protein
MLDRLVSDRSGLRISKLELSWIAPDATPDDEWIAHGLGAILRGRVYSLPAELPEGGTFVVARRTRLDTEKGGLERWELNWERRPAPEIPPYIRDRNVADLEPALQRVWNERHATLTIQVGYYVAHHKTKLLTTKKQRRGTLSATPGATYWNINGGDVLEGFSPFRREQGVGVIAIGTAEFSGWPNVADVEQRLWSDVVKLLDAQDER